MLDFFLKRSIKSGFRKYQRNSCFLNYSDIKSVLIFFDMEKWEEVKPIIEELRADGKRVTAWTVKKEVEGRISFPYYIRVVDTNAEVNWLRMLKPEVVSEFERVEYDTLINLSYSDNDYLLYLLSRNKSRFCIGLVETEYKIYDFILLRDKESETDLYESYQQLKNFLKQIQ